MMWGIGFRVGQYVKGSLWIVPVAGRVVGLGVAEVDRWRAAQGVLPTWQHRVYLEVHDAVAAFRGSTVP